MRQRGIHTSTPNFGPFGSDVVTVTINKSWNDHRAVKGLFGSLSRLCGKTSKDTSRYFFPPFLNSACSAAERTKTTDSAAHTPQPALPPQRVLRERFSPPARITNGALTGDRCAGNPSSRGSSANPLRRVPAKRHTQKRQIAAQYENASFCQKLFGSRASGICVRSLLFATRLDTRKQMRRRTSRQNSYLSGGEARANTRSQS